MPQQLTSQHSNKQQQQITTFPIHHPKQNFFSYLPYIILIRSIFILFIIDGAFWPDQIYQGPEVAYKLAYGFGHQTWQYTTKSPIRNYLFPFLISLVYQVCKFFQITNPYIIQLAPKIYQIVIAILFDYFILKVNSLYNKYTAKQLLFFIYFNGFFFNMMCRVFSNSSQTTFCLIAFYFWKLRHSQQYYDLYSRILVILVFLIRSTSLLVWAIIWIMELFSMEGRMVQRMRFILKNIITIIFLIGSSLLTTYLFTGEFYLIEYNFIKTNLVNKISSNFGVQPFYYYFVFSILFVNFGLLPIAICIKNIFKNNIPQKIHDFKQLLIIILFFLIIYSLQTHKQFRFILFYFPFISILYVRGIIQLKSNYQFLIKTSLIITNIIIFLILNIYQSAPNDAIRLMKNIQFQKSILLRSQAYFYPLYGVLNKNVKIVFQSFDPNVIINQIQKTGDNQMMIKESMVKNYEQMFEYIAVKNKQKIFINGWQEYQNKYIKVFEGRKFRIDGQEYVEVYKKIS